MPGHLASWQDTFWFLIGPSLVSLSTTWLDSCTESLNLILRARALGSQALDSSCGVDRGPWGEQQLCPHSQWSESSNHIGPTLRKPISNM